MRMIDADAYRTALRHKANECDALSKSGSRRAPQYANIMLGINMATMELDSASTVDAEVVQHGYWILKLPKGYSKYAKKCSVCGSIQAYGRLHHCPECGAKMDKEVPDD